MWFLLTCRPDLIPVDLKRQGRAEEHIALFYPDTVDERRALLRAMQKKCGIQLAADVEQSFVEHSAGLSGADLEAVLARTRMKSTLRNSTEVSADDVQSVLDDFVPPSYPNEIELQNLVAVLECTSRSLLPERYRTANRGELIARLNQLAR
jgi:ATP-dependent 26S proteasome regulatory subunit